MVSDTNFLLVGNSRLHWAESFQNEYKFFHTEKNISIPKSFNISNLIWASVGDLSNLFLREKNQIKTQDIKLENLPEYFGVDRALGCLAALKTITNPYKKDLLIADFGTTLTLTKLTARGSIIGGQIAPGFRTQLRAMAHYTKNLNVPRAFDIPIPNFLITTEDSMLKGVFNSLLGVINLSFNPRKDILIICGGDSNLMLSELEKKNGEIINSPDLVMQGMIYHFQSLK